MSRISLNKDEVNLLVLDFLRQNQMIASQRCLEKESGIRIDSFGKELDFLYSLVMDGDWSDVEAFVSPLQRYKEFNFRKTLFEIRRARFLEMLDSQSISRAVEELSGKLKELEDICSRDEFSKLCYLITLPKLSDHPEYRTWDKHKGRNECFDRIKPLVAVCYSTEAACLGARMEPNRLVTLLKQALLFQIGHYQANHPSQPIPSPLECTLLSDFDINDAVPNPTKTHVVSESGQAGHIAPKRYRPLNAQSSRSVNFADGPILSGSIPEMVVNSDERPGSTSTDARGTMPVAVHPRPPKVPRAASDDQTDQTVVDLLRENAGGNLSWSVPRGPRDTTGEMTVRKPGDVEENGDMVASEPAAASFASARNEAPKSKSSMPLPVPSSVAEQVKPEDNIPFTAIEPPAIGGRDFGVAAMYNSSSTVRCVGFHPSGDRLAIGGNSHGVSILSCGFAAASRHEISNLSVLVNLNDIHRGSVYCLNWCSDGEHLATGSNDRSVVITNTVRLHGDDDDGKESAVILMGHTGSVASVCFHPNHSHLLSTCELTDGSIRLWDWNSEVVVRRMSGHTKGVTSLSMSADGAFLASGSKDGSLRIWDMRISHACIRTFSNAPAVSSVSMPSGVHQNVAAGYIDGSVVLWDWNSGKRRAELRHHAAEVRSVALDPRGELLAAGSFDSSVSYIDVQSLSLLQQERAHQGRVSDVGWHPHIPMLASAGADHKVLLWTPSRPPLKQ